MNKEDYQMDKWNKTKVKGKRRYLLITGVLPFGIMSLLVSSYMAFIYNRSLLDHFENIIFTYLMYFVVWCLIGAFLGNMNWNNNVKKFEQ